MHGASGIVDGIKKERVLLKPLRLKAKINVDTTAMSIRDLSKYISKVLSQDDLNILNVNIFSFGFKHGAPIDANFVVDVRFLPNPYWDTSLRNMTGLDREVIDYVFKSGEAYEFIDRYVNFLELVFKGYIRENRHNISLAVGCTGGKHRSVAIVEEIGKRISAENIYVSIRHRDIEVH
jgi:UPF0042 nucleotide-binding protein